jgi:hypothetical protein
MSFRATKEGEIPTVVVSLERDLWANCCFGGVDAKRAIHAKHFLNMDITSKTYYAAYQQALGQRLVQNYAAYNFAAEKQDVGYQTQVAAVFSANIEGNTLTFYFASLLHLRFVHIHPFVDGNGRAARLLEKWFLAHHLGPPGWQVPAERYYKEHRADYYNHLNLGVNFYELDYDQCLPFLLMLPRSLEDGG